MILLMVDQIEGVAAAADAYFDKKPKELSLGESAFFAGLLLHQPNTRHAGQHRN